MNRETYDKVMAYLAENGNEPELPKNFIKFAPYSADVYPESFTPEPISIEADGDGGIIVFDDNVTEITVEGEAFAAYTPSSIEFCENVKYIKSTAFDNCGYTEIKFHSIVPPEFSWELGNFSSTMNFNGIIYYPAGSDYSSLRSVTTDRGHKLLFENFEFIEFNPSPAPEPEEPEDSVIEYHWEIPMEDVEPSGVFGDMWLEKEVGGDYTEIYNKIYKVYSENADEYGSWYGDVTEKTNLTVNGYRVTSFEQMWGNDLYMLFEDGPSHANGVMAFYLATDKIRVEIPYVQGLV